MALEPASPATGGAREGQHTDLLVVAVEASADLHGAAVLRELRALHPGVRAFGAGGPRLREEGCDTLVRAEDLSVMGVVEVIPAIPRILRALSKLGRAAEERRPAAALLVDSPDFNLRLARRLRRLGIPVVYFIGPTVWAWRTYRLKQIARDVARMLVILPFEAAFYARHGVQATYVGNPVADEAGPRSDRGELRASLGLHPNRRVVALLPGSRRQEILRLFRPMLQSAVALGRHVPDLQIVVPVAPTVARELLEREAARVEELGDAAAEIVYVPGRARDALAAADAAIVASGTATLEAALTGTPLVVVYKVNWLTWLLGKMLVRAPYVALVNLLAGRRVVPELLQGHCTSERIASELAPLLQHGPERAVQIEAMRRVRAELVPAGVPAAARRAAEELASVLQGVR